MNAFIFSLLFLLSTFYCPFYPIKEFSSLPFRDELVYGDPIFSSTDVVEYNQLSDFLSFKYSSLNPSLLSEHRLYGLGSYGSVPFYNLYGESVFHKHISGSTYASEGNCGLISTSNALAYYKTYGGKNQFPTTSSTTNIIPQANASVFADAISHGYSPKSSNVSIHTIYAKEREYAISLGYTISGLNNSQTESMFESTCSFYGYSNSDFVGTTTCDVSTLLNELDYNRPVQIRTTNDSAYNSHGMMATGYKYYSVTIYDSYWDVYYQSNLLFVSVWDGSTSERWYDIPSCTSLPSIYQRADNVTIAKMIVS